jgi:hypothetical protein
MINLDYGSGLTRDIVASALPRPADTSALPARCQGDDFYAFANVDACLAAGS